jgi:hypothetical protein
VQNHRFTRQKHHNIIIIAIIIIMSCFDSHLQGVEIAGAAWRAGVAPTEKVDGLSVE